MKNDHVGDELILCHTDDTVATSHSGWVEVEV